MAKKPSQNRAPFRLVTLIEHDLLNEIEALAHQAGFGVTRSDIVRGILWRAIRAQRMRRKSVRAAS